MTTSNLFNFSILFSIIFAMMCLVSCSEDPALDITEVDGIPLDYDYQCYELQGATGYGELTKPNGGKVTFSYQFNPNRPHRSRFALTLANGNVFKGVINSGSASGEDGHYLDGTVSTRNGVPRNDLYVSFSAEDVARSGANNDNFSYYISNGSSYSGTLTRGDITTVSSECDDCCQFETVGAF